MKILKKNSKSLIESIESYKNHSTTSLSEELELQDGDELLTIDGITPQDMIDYNFMCKTEEMVLEIQKADSGEVEVIELEKDYVIKKIQDNKKEDIKDEIFDIAGTVDIKADGNTILPDNVFQQAHTKTIPPSWDPPGQISAQMDASYRAKR